MKRKRKRKRKQIPEIVRRSSLYPRRAAEKVEDEASCSMTLMSSTRMATHFDGVRVFSSTSNHSPISLVVIY